MTRTSTGFLSELKRRRVYQAAAVYIAVGLGILGAAELILDPLGLAAARPFIVVLVLLGFPLALVLAWAYELKPEHPVVSSQEASEATGVFNGSRASGNTGSPAEGRVLPPPERSVAVLPFVNLGGDPENEYFADGITEDVIAQLSKIRALKVISRTSVMSFKNRQVPMREIAQQLDVATLLEGSVRRAGNRVRVVAQLIDSAADRHLWSETYDRELTDIFGIQSDLAIRIAEALQAELSPDERQKLRDHAAPAKAPQPQAYEAYLRGRFHFYQQSPEGLANALRCFEQALEYDPHYTLALGAIADTWGARTKVGLVAPREAYPIVRERVRKALQLNDALAETNDWMGRLRFWFEWDWEAAEWSYQRAIELNSNYPDARMMYSVLLSVANRWDEAAAQAARAIELDPLNAFFQWARALQPLIRRQYHDAHEQLLETLRLEPAFVMARLDLWTVLHQENRYDEGLAHLIRYFDGIGDKDVVRILEDGRGPEGYRRAMYQAAGALAERFRENYLPPTLVARLYACADEPELAVQWLERAYTERDFDMVSVGIHPAWDRLRSLDAFVKLVERMQFPRPSRHP